MRCNNCGEYIKDGSKFCENCGNKVIRKRSRLIKMVCNGCGGSMEFDSKSSIISCPFCGSKKIFVESDDVKINRDREETKRLQQEYEYKTRSKEYEEKTKRTESENLLTLCAIMSAVIIMLFILIFAKNTLGI